MPPAIPPEKTRRPPRDFFRADPVTLARRLLGQRLVRFHHGQRLSGLIVETEAYLGAIDAAAHTYRGKRTQRNNSMFFTGGHAYVYFTYGMHHCMNVVAGEVDEPVAVLIRALEPTEGLDAMRTLRPAAKKDTALCSGPGKLCQALSITRLLDGHDLMDGDALWIEQERTRVLPDKMIGVSARIGVAYAGEWANKPLRFFVIGNPNVSRP